MIMYQYWLINCGKGTPLVEDVNDRGKGRQGDDRGMGVLYFLLSVSVNQKLLKNKVYYFIKNYPMSSF